VGGADAPSPRVVVPGGCRAVPGSTDLRQRREAIVRRHMESENAHDFGTTIETFAHPRYEIIATDRIHDGLSEVQAYFRESRTAFCATPMMP
jgi:hypothetical protein